MVWKWKLALTFLRRGRRRCRKQWRWLWIERIERGIGAKKRWHKNAAEIARAMNSLRICWTCYLKKLNCGFLESLLPSFFLQSFLKEETTHSQSHATSLASPEKDARNQSFPPKPGFAVNPSHWKMLFNWKRSLSLCEKKKKYLKNVVLTLFYLIFLIS